MITAQSLFVLIASLGSGATDAVDAPRTAVRTVQRFDSQWVMKANEVLREGNLRGRVLEDVAAELAGYGPNAIQAYFAILAGTVDGPTEEGALRPSADALDPNEILFATLARMNPKEVAAHVAAAATGDAPLDVRIVALHVLDLVGAEGGLDAWFRIVSEVEPEHLSRAYVQGPCERALAAVASRDGTAFQGLKTRLPKLQPALVPIVLRGIAASRRPQALPVLTSLLGKSNELDLVLLPCIGKLAEETVGDLTDEELAWIRPFADDDDWRVRREALIVLGRVGDWRSAGLLVEALGDEQRLVGQAANWSLARMSRVDHGFDAESWTAFFDSEIRWFESEVPRCVQAIESRNPATALDGVRELAGHALFRHDAARAIGFLLADPHADLVAQACVVLTEIRSPAAIPALIEALSSEDASIREAARAALAAITNLELAPDATAWRRALVGT